MSMMPRRSSAFWTGAPPPNRLHPSTSPPLHHLAQNPDEMKESTGSWGDFLHLIRILGQMKRWGAAGQLVGLVRLGKPHHMLPEIREHEVVVDRSHLIEPRLAKLALDVVLDGEAETAVGVHGGIGGGPRGL
jgi:hypothetical protein